ncbi:hypothetical protein [Lacticaseibacillus rhamnosus]|uniref:hypothetical protein n=1 Tax=Lacticaseibacillus rhamnosus TaxID=47715 RepID=UPI00237F1089|nr:hypothetical protein [Lacticaseibacillus rhamnosus]MDE3301576.1 hypothetical protein [Lacticaseibacillus rhamnosus]
MSNETKQDVFNALMADMSHGSEQWRARYDAAFPDNLPVIPKDVSEWLTWCKRKRHSLKDGLDGETRVSEDVFARAWVLGVCIVEETGEIVKLEAEK